MTLVTMRDAIASTIATRVPTLQQVAGHGGSFNRAEIRRVSLRLPAVLVTCLGLGSVQARGGGVSMDARWAAWIVTRDSVETPRGDQAVLLAELIANLVPVERWGQDNVGPARDVRAENLFSGELDKGGAALWVVTWRQVFESAVDPSVVLDEFLTLHANTDLAPADGALEAADVVTLEGEG